MSTYTVNKICHRVVHDVDFRARLLDAPRQALEGLDLEPVEVEALASGNVAALHERGVLDFLLYQLLRYGIGGLTLDAYVEQIHRFREEPGSPAAG